MKARTPQVSPEQPLLTDSIIDFQDDEPANFEQVMKAQAARLNALFVELAGRSAKASTANYLEAADRYMRLALKAQSQCRATLEALHAVGRSSSSVRLTTDNPE